MTSETIEILLHPEPYTVDEILARHPGDPRVELVEGALVVAPWPTFLHQWVADELRSVLRASAPLGVRAATSVNLRLDPAQATLFVPDVVVTTAQPRSVPLYLDADEVLAVVEVVSPSSRSHDRLLKAHHYAAAGIGCYWRIELDPFPGRGDDALPVVLVHQLVDGAYEERTRLAAGTVGTTDLPFPVALDPADLLR